MFLLAGAIYAIQNCKKKTVVEFESFEASNPTPVSVVSDMKGK